MFSRAQQKAAIYKQYIYAITRSHKVKDENDNDIYLSEVADLNGYVTIYGYEIERTDKASHIQFMTNNGTFYYWVPLSAIHEDDVENINSGNFKTKNSDKFKKERKSV